MMHTGWAGTGEKSLFQPEMGHYACYFGQSSYNVKSARFCHVKITYLSCFLPQLSDKGRSKCTV